MNIDARGRFERLGAAFRESMNAGDYISGLKYAEMALRIQPANPVINADYAFCLLRTHDVKKAYKTYMKLYSRAGVNGMPGTSLDGLTETCGHLGKTDEVRRFGLYSLERADKQFSGNQKWLLSGNPPPFEKGNKKRNVISFSLFGSNPRYCETSVMNVQVAAELFPEWSCRFYIDDSVPVHTIERLRSCGATIILVNEDIRQIPGTLWRFLVADDRSVSRYLIRDADALLSERDQAAVEEWANSNYWFHHMRDWFTHTELLLAGMWGGCTTSDLPEMKQLIICWLQQQKETGRFTDQFFLRECLWSTIRESLLSHDDIFGFFNACSFPHHPRVRWYPHSFHVGSNASYKAVHFQPKVKNGQMQQWELVEGEGHTIASYYTPVQDDICVIHLPFFLTDKLSDGTMRLVCS